MRGLGWLYLLALAGLGGVQLALRADVWLLAILLLIAAAALLPLTRGGWRVSDGMYAIMTVYFGSGALVVKTLAGQPVQSNLHVPDLSAAYLLAGFGSITIGYGLSQGVRRPLRFARALRRVTGHEPNLRRFAVPIFALGAMFLLLQTQFRAIAVSGGFTAGGFGGFGTFYPLLMLGAAMQAALVIRRPDQRRHGLVLAAMAATILALTLADNTKRTLFDFLFVVALAFVALNGRVRWRWVGPGSVAAACIFALLLPAIQIVRTDPDVRGTARIAATWDVLRANGFSASRLSAAQARVATGYRFAWIDSYVHPLTWNSERFTMIQPIDQVARGLAEHGTMGSADLWRDPAEALLPGFLIRKSLVTAPDRIAWHYGFRAKGSIARPVVGLIASSLAAFGLAGVLLLPGAIAAISFTLLDLVGGRLSGNVWAVFLLAATAFLAEREASTMLAFFCRSFPFILIVGGALLLVARRPRRAAAAGDGRDYAPISARRLATNAGAE
ncbi:hypothetical protein [Sphingomonas sp. Ag1]|uniref:hypothetical protein n=1 Tax=Sphingomonas sp. Ag1 TaxID=1642949 RepID=UPI0006228A27|nr:hypothetical protein [Sphingomonas sp. Ag1]KKI20479.1 hypothetical protein XM50_05205 [Sphingomonas sp. Ag1]